MDRKSFPIQISSGRNRSNKRSLHYSCSGLCARNPTIRGPLLFPGLLRAIRREFLLNGVLKNILVSCSRASETLRRTRKMHCHSRALILVEEGYYGCLQDIKHGFIPSISHSHWLDLRLRYGLIAKLVKHSPIVKMLAKRPAWIAAENEVSPFSFRFVVIDPEPHPSRKRGLEIHRFWTDRLIWGELGFVSKLAKSHLPGGSRLAKRREGGRKTDQPSQKIQRRNAGVHSLQPHPLPVVAEMTTALPGGLSRHTNEDARNGSVRDEHTHPEELEGLSIQQFRLPKSPTMSYFCFTAAFLLENRRGITSQQSVKWLVWRSTKGSRVLRLQQEKGGMEKSILFLFSEIQSIGTESVIIVKKIRHRDFDESPGFSTSPSPAKLFLELCLPNNTVTKKCRELEEENFVCGFYTKIDFYEILDEICLVLFLFSEIQSIGTEGAIIAKKIRHRDFDESPSFRTSPSSAKLFLELSLPNNTITKKCR
ncbi:hypothetical protein AVEN_122825-1 [Araneus ventricosus]|uniref:Uncharacterized protein n=1 Tax=Araneus ventricosus TaxID=182803 RepID=A0A4Y2JJN9_ARAVE|nr:hypothetical protein AVEN_122825-1 [Araneus ventricosus]